MAKWKANGCSEHFYMYESVTARFVVFMMLFLMLLFSVTDFLKQTSLLGGCLQTIKSTLLTLKLDIKSLFHREQDDGSMLCCKYTPGICEELYYSLRVL